MQRHQLVYATLGARMGREIHALSIQAYTPAGMGGLARTPGSALTASRAWTNCRSAVACRSTARYAFPAPRTPRCRSWPARCSPTGRSTIGNVPHLNDVTTMIELLGAHGRERHGRRAHAHRGRPAHDRARRFAPYDLVKTMRASILVLGPLVARYGAADVSLPGGCAIGARPVNIHVAGLQAMGADVAHRERLHQGARRRGCKGARIVLETVTVTGTENLMMAAALADGRTVLENAAREPEVVDLANFLIAMGARITRRRHRHDRRSTASRRCTARSTTCCRTASRPAPTSSPARSPAAASASRNARPEHLDAVLGKLEEAGAHVDARRRAGSKSTCAAGGRRSVDIRTAPHPAFPTDMQAQFAALNTVARRRRHDHRDDLRESLHAHARDAAHGCGDPPRGQHGDHQGRAAADRRAGDGHRSARVRRASCWPGSWRRARPTWSASTTSTAATKCIEEKLQGLGAQIRRCRGPLSAGHAWFRRAADPRGAPVR